jgi:hypothetical protein
MNKSKRYADYPEAIYWLAVQRQTPVDVMRVSGWKLVQFTAKIFHKSAHQVAADLIDYSIGFYNRSKEGVAEDRLEAQQTKER